MSRRAFHNGNGRAKPVALRLFIELAGNKECGRGIPLLCGLPRINRQAFVKRVGFLRKIRNFRTDQAEPIRPLVDALDSLKTLEAARSITARSL